MPQKDASGFCRKVRFLGQNRKIGYQKFNDLQTAKISKKQLCDRTLNCLCLPLYARLAWSLLWWTLKTPGLAAALLPQKALISDLTAATTRGTGYGLHTFATGLGSAVGPLVGGWVYETWGHTAPFVLTGLLLLASLARVPLLLQGPSLGGAPHRDERHAVAP